ncbi:type II toxin-antitoxin system VapB family antitoxin [Phenylobacterium sp.]|uniref:type II toxin-antitoxin system VapB family antitoxin n=1 Tax=Phenylobacterium sp. TaxID=1871053 RepID=UPI002731844A|nr:type II toxin-antitoxin system VapB family antitoxin [Phenylobacterium sp.]MDP1873880.1 type II toxin-antitoxin system VapB family antitoxin [Phenylobacterium sp.]
MTRTTLFQSNGAQAVRLPRDTAFSDSVREVEVVRGGTRRVIVPVDASWNDLFEGPGGDLGERDQPEPQTREWFELP